MAILTFAKNWTMRYSLVCICLLAVIFTGCQLSGSTEANSGKSPYAGTATGSTGTAKLTSIQWKEKSIDYGKINEGQKIDIAFRFTNTGNLPLVIDRVEPSCGCTVADIPKEPVAPGKEGVIKGSFNSEGKTHTQHKTLLVYANAKDSQPAELSFVVEVEPKK